MARVARILFAIVLFAVGFVGILLLLRGTGFMSVWDTDDPEAFRREPLPVEFTVVSYNIQGRPVLDDTKGKFPEIGRRLEPFDIVGIQECFTNYDVLYEAADFPVMVYHGTRRSPLKLVGSGLGNLSRFPLIEHASMHYTTKGEFQNRPASKGILMTRHDIGGHTVDVYNTHLEAGGSEEALIAKEQQVEEIIAFVQEHSPPEHTVIFVGDFNMRPLREYHLEEARAAGFDPPESGIDIRITGFQRMMEGLGEGFFDTQDVLHGIPVAYAEENRDAPWWRRQGREHIDRILYRAGTGMSLEPLDWHRHIDDFRAGTGELLSDHDPISVRFRLEAL